MKMLICLLRKEFWQLRRNKFVHILTLVLPIVYITVFPLVANMDIKHINVVVVDNDNSSMSRRLIANLQACEYFSCQRVVNSYPEALEEIGHGSADIVLQIAPGFERQLLVNTQGQGIFIAANAVNGNKGILGIGYLSNQLTHFVGQEMNSLGRSMCPAQEIKVIPNYQYNPLLDYKINIIPAIMIMLVVMLVGFLPALNIVQEKESGTIEQLNVTPITRYAFITAKIIPYWLIGMIAINLCLICSWLVFGITPVGSIWGIYGFVFLTIFVVSTLGLIVSNLCDTIQQAAFVMLFFVIVFFLLSGMFTPIYSMPQWAQLLTMLNPLRFLVEGVRALFIKGSNFFDLWREITFLVTFGILFTLSSILTYKKT